MPKHLPHDGSNFLSVGHLAIFYNSIGIWLSISYFPDYVLVITPVISLFLMPLMHMANILFLFGYDAVCDVVDLFNRRQLRVSKSAKSISEDISLILGLLK